MTGIRRYGVALATLLSSLIAGVARSGAAAAAAAPGPFTDGRRPQIAETSGDPSTEIAELAVVLVVGAILLVSLAVRDRVSRRRAATLAAS